MRHRNSLSAFLSLGYFLDYRNTAIDIDTSGVSKKRYADAEREDLVKIGVEIFRRAISASFEPNRQHLVPLSGGMDSRAVLAGLLEHTSANKVHTYTFGTPHTLDYDIGSHVAAKLGTRHTSFDLTNYAYTQDELLDVSRRVDRQTTLFYHAPVWEIDRRFGGASCWSGFMGDPLAGSHLDRTPSQTIAAAKRHFIERNLLVKSTNLAAPYADLASMIEGEYMSREELTLDEQLDFRNRQLKYVAPHVLMRGYSYKLPFLHRAWIDFMLSVDNRHRRHQLLYRDILRRAFPKAFSYGTKNNRGLPLGASELHVLARKATNRIRRAFGGLDAAINYLDFDREIRRKADLREVVCSNIRDLTKRGLVEWIDVSGLLDRHLSGAGNYADALLSLTSLELHMKTGKTL